MAAGIKSPRRPSMGSSRAELPRLEPVPHGDALDSWLAKGYAGTMRYLHRQAKKRKEPARIVAGAKSVIVVLENYYPSSAVSRPSVSPSVRPSVWRSTRRAKTTTAPFSPGSTRSGPSFASAAPRSRTPSPTRARCPSASWPNARGWAGSARTRCSSGPARDRSSSSGRIFTDLELAGRPAVRARSLRDMHPLPRSLSDRRVRRGAGARRDPLSLLPHHRVEGCDSRGAGRTRRGLGLRLRHLQRRLSLE